MRWFRMYSEVRHDPKIQTMPGELVKAWLNLMCFAADNQGYLPATRDMAWDLRVTEHKLETAVVSLMGRGLIEDRPEGLYMHNWNVRQFQSDSSTERVREHRKKQAGNVALEVPRNVAVTVDSSVICNLSSPKEETTNKTTEERNVSGASDELEAEIDRAANQIHDRHPKQRRCSAAMVKVKLRQIAKKVPAAGRVQRVKDIAENHSAWCEYWAKGDPIYAKSLENWLAPTMARFDEEPPFLLVQKEQPSPRGMLL